MKTTTTRPARWLKGGSTCHASLTAWIPSTNPRVEGKDQFRKVVSWPPHLCCTPALRTTTRFLVPPSNATQIIQARLHSPRVYFNKHPWMLNSRLTALPPLPDYRHWIRIILKWKNKRNSVTANDKNIHSTVGGMVKHPLISLIF